MAFYTDLNSTAVPLTLANPIWTGTTETTNGYIYIYCTIRSDVSMTLTVNQSTDGTVNDYVDTFNVIKNNNTNIFKIDVKSRFFNVKLENIDIVDQTYLKLLTKFVAVQNATSTISGTNVTVTNFPVTQSVSGSVSVSNFPATQPVSGTFYQATQPISGSVSITKPAGLTLSHTGWIATATAVSNTFNIDNYSIVDILVKVTAFTSGSKLWFQLSPDGTVWIDANENTFTVASNNLHAVILGLRLGSQYIRIYSDNFVGTASIYINCKQF